MAGRPTPAEEPLNAAALRVAIVASRYHRAVCDDLVDGALRFLREHGAPDADVHWVPGAFELPLAARACVEAGADAVVAIGCIIRGDTPHFSVVVRESAAGIMRVMLDSGVPVTNAILTVENLEQARARAGGSEGNKGWDAAASAVEMALFVQAQKPDARA